LKSGGVKVGLYQQLGSVFFTARSIGLVRYCQSKLSVCLRL